MIRTLIILLLTCTALSNAAAQTLPAHFNLITNGGFEFKYFDAITDSSFSDNKDCWIAANRFGAPVWSETPANRHYIRAHSGHSATGLRSAFPGLSAPPVTWSDTLSPGFRPYPETRLAEPLIAGVTYFFSVYAGIGKNMKGFNEGADHVISNVGVYCSATAIRSPASGRLAVQPQLNFPAWDIPYEDSLMYVKLSGSFVASGGEQYLTIGNFDYYANFNFLFAPEGLYRGFPTFYPLLDDLSLVRDTTQPMISLDHFSLGNDSILCAGDTIRLQAPPFFFHYRWSTGDTTSSASVTKPGTYWCRADYGCNTITDTIRIRTAAAPQGFDLPDTSLCAAALPVLFRAPAAATDYHWSNGSSAPDLSIGSFGTFWLSVDDACHEKNFTDTFKVRSAGDPVPAFSLGPDITNCDHYYYLDTILLQLPETANNIQWSTGSNAAAIRICEPGIYYARIYNACYTRSDTMTLAGCPDTEVIHLDIPNAFTPNGDGSNDVFRVRYLPVQVSSFDLKIFNRWGALISELKSAADYWDGNGYDIGAYYYLCVFKGLSGRSYQQKGDITLIR